MTGSVSVSVVIPWKDRPALRDTLLANERYFSPDRCEVIVANCGGDRERLAEIVAGTPVAVRTVAASLTRFNKSHALNIGVSATTGAVLLLLDADVVLKTDLIELARANANAGTFCTVAWVEESDRAQAPAPAEGVELAYFTEITVPGGRRIRLETNRVRPHQGLRSGPGLIAVRREHFLAVGGMNAELEGWGFEDLDLVARLQFELGLERVQAGEVLHLSHPDDARVLFGQTRAESERANYLTCLANYSAGMFQGSYEQDVAAGR